MWRVGNNFVKKLFVAISKQSVNVWCIAFSVAQLRASAEKRIQKRIAVPNVGPLQTYNST